MDQKAVYKQTLPNQSEHYEVRTVLISRKLWDELADKNLAEEDENSHCKNVFFPSQIILKLVNISNIHVTMIIRLFNFFLDIFYIF